jgi:hypothetical protein
MLNSNHINLIVLNHSYWFDLIGIYFSTNESIFFPLGKSYHWGELIQG